MTLNYFYCVTYWTDLTKFMYVPILWTETCSNVNAYVLVVLCTRICHNTTGKCFK